MACSCLYLKVDTNSTILSMLRGADWQCWTVLENLESIFLSVALGGCSSKIFLVYLSDGYFVDGKGRIDLVLKAGAWMMGQCTFSAFWFELKHKH